MYYFCSDSTNILQLVSDPVCFAHPILMSKLSEHFNSMRKITAMAVISRLILLKEKKLSINLYLRIKTAKNVH